LSNTESSNTPDEGLVRVIGVGALGLSVMNLVIGAGIFVLPGLVAAELGSAALLAYLVCSVTVALVFLCFAEVGSRVSRSGGAYAYVEEAFGPLAGFVASILFWFGYSALADAAITVVMVDAIASVVPGLVPLEGGATCRLALRILTLHRTRDLDQADRLARLEQQRQQVGEPLDAIDHPPVLSGGTRRSRDPSCARAGRRRPSGTATAAGRRAAP